MERIFVTGGAGYVGAVTIPLLLDKGYKNRGNHYVVWDGSSLNGKTVSNGLYIYRLEGENNLILTKKVILLK